MRLAMAGTHETALRHSHLAVPFSTACLFCWQLTDKPRLTRNTPVELVYSKVVPRRSSGTAGTKAVTESERSLLGAEYNILHQSSERQSRFAEDSVT